VGEDDGEQHEHGGDAMEHDLGVSGSSGIPGSASYPALRGSFGEGARPAVPLR
jgi:hypothetical protein